MKLSDVIDAFSESHTKANLAKSEMNLSYAANTAEGNVSNANVKPVERPELIEINKKLRELKMEAASAMKRFVAESSLLHKNLATQVKSFIENTIRKIKASNIEETKSAQEAEAEDFKESMKAVSYTHLTLPTTPYV
eukprot:TRINITY_DN3610_c0_g4_i1.p1 TRINITY_DN3610_c0_g4~~TRINITY_DN3610_c0_g4_i1.p1  ORF type:complete len:137 (-),score=17.37 TRINITY_DN3610_c0_g4_i1:42-452(-)